MSTIKVEEIQHPSNSNNAVSIASDSSVSLKHSGSAKLATTSTGVSVTGTCAATTLSGSLASSNLTGALPAIDGSALTGVGGGGFEFVSKSEITSGTAAYIEFTNFDNDTAYRMVCKQIYLNFGNYAYLQFQFKDTSGNLLTGKLNYQRLSAYSGTSVASQGYLSQDKFYGAGAVHGTGASKEAFILEFFCKPDDNWFNLDAWAIDRRRAYMRTWGCFESDDTTTQIGGIRISPTAGSFAPDSQILLYKYKES